MGDVRVYGKGLAFRLLICNRCSAVWPTEREERHGGSRQDGEPCAYRWADGAVCSGSVHPFGTRGRRFADKAAAERVRAYSGGWCEVLNLKWGTTDLALVRKHYRELAKTHHPDVGGETRRMADINEAYKQALAELGQR